MTVLSLRRCSSRHASETSCFKAPMPRIPFRLATESAFDWPLPSTAHATGRKPISVLFLSCPDSSSAPRIPSMSKQEKATPSAVGEVTLKVGRAVRPQPQFYVHFPVCCVAAGPDVTAVTLGSDVRHTGAALQAGVFPGAGHCNLDKPAAPACLRRSFLYR